MSELRISSRFGGCRSLLEVDVVHILGICFAGTSTTERGPMARFVDEVLGLPRRHVDGVEADLFTLPGGHLYELVERLVR